MSKAEGVISGIRTATAIWSCAGLQPTRKKVSVPIVIHFPWNAAALKFVGEKIFFDTAEFTKQLSENTT